MNSREIRKRFLDFFKDKGHDIVKSAPMVIKNDPTLMFTNAGMNQFKDYFLGNKEAANPRVADTQKCLRVSGKHNDLEEVGKDTYHHTMFEMLGNWSFGEYFKKEAIEWAWEFLTKDLKIDSSNMYATVFEGDKSQGLEPDDESFKEWEKHLPKERILYQDKKDNFWEMGDTGPCGPSSEIHVDLRTEEEKKEVPGVDLVNKDHPHVIEIWNLVFIQFNRMASGELKQLSQKHVDTGLGFERLCMLMQKKKSNYDTDVFTPLIAEIEKLSGKSYGKNEDIDVAMRVIADHVRAVSIAISEGQLPSNAKAGYVIRRILRRAVRYAYTFLDVKEAFMYKLLPVLSKQFEGVFEEIVQQEDFISKVILEEENSFLHTLEKGLKRLDVILADVKGKSSQIAGPDVFELYDTFGFPPDLTALIAGENGIEIDEKGFEAEMAKQKGRSKKDAESSSDDWVEIQSGETEFVGYDNTECDTQILRYRKVSQKGKHHFQLVIGKTPFYAEGGGQVGDKGVIIKGNEKIRISNTIKENDLILHITENLPEDLSGTWNAFIDKKKRLLTENNHSATHLLHAALRQVLGTHVQQKGSLVNEKLLRFDFSHFSKMTVEEIKEVEDIVNAKVRENIIRQEERHVSFDEAVSRGAMALFGEKYGDDVRVITFDPKYSIELCGGTHVRSSGEIGLFKIVSESSVAAGVRRIEAITAERSEEYVRNNENLLTELNDLFKNPKDLLKSVQNLVKEKNELSKRLEEQEKKEIEGIRKKIADGVEVRDNAEILNIQTELPSADGLKQILFELKQKYRKLFAVIAADIKGKPQIGIMIGDDLLGDDSMNAGKLIKEWAREIKGGGGGQAFFATAGGSDVSGLKNVNEKAAEFIKEKF